MPLFKQKYKVGPGLDNSTADGSKDFNSYLQQRSFGFLKLVNAYVSRRKGAAMKRGGSLTETIAGTLNKPLGMGVYKKGTETSLMPVETINLINFAGVLWKKFEAGAYATLTTNANTSFSITKQSQFAQLGTTMGIAAGKPARWNQGATEIEMMGYPKSSTAITFVTAAGALNPIYGYTWVWTYYNSVTGKESDWSPISANSGAQTAKKFTLTLPTTASGSSADKKRIYRNTDGGTVYRFVADIAIATGTYDDNNADTTLGAQIADSGVKAVPPTNSFVIKNFNSRFWLNDASNPYQLAFSAPFIGNNNDVEYFHPNNRLNFPHEVVGAWVGTAGMYVFGVRDISLVTGYDLNTFQIESFKQGVGTSFANSVVGNGDTICFLGENCFKAIIGGRIVDISDNIDEDLRILLNGTYNNFIYVSSAYNHAMGQFLFCISASSSVGTPWILSASSSPDTWYRPDTGDTVYWIIPGAPTTDDLTRVKVWGFNPLDQEWSEYTFPQCADLNTSQQSINFLVTPYGSSLTLDPQQEITFLGINGGTNAGIVVGAFRADKSKDDSAAVHAVAITDKIQPGRQDSTYKRFRHILIEGSYLDVAAAGGTINYILDFHDPQLRNYAGALYPFDGGDDGVPTRDMKAFTVGKGRFFHLEIKDFSSRAGNILFQSFTVHFIEKELREGR